MTITTLSSREFNQDTGHAKKAASEGPVFITERGRPAYVLLCIDEYQRIAGHQDSIIDRLGLPPGIEDVAIDFPHLRELSRPADFSSCFRSTPKCDDVDAVYMLVQHV
jgi:prevent-host-death family protein